MQYLDYDKNKIKWDGESPVNKTFLLAPMGPESPVMIFNASGQLLLEKQTDGFPANFVQLSDLSGYSYFAGKTYVGPKWGSVQGYSANGRYIVGKLYITDNNLETQKIIDYIPTPKIPKVIGLHMHGNYVLDSNHYLLQAISLEEVIIKTKKSYVVNCILQEQLNGEVIWEWQSIDYPELFEASFARNNYFDKKVINKEYACDYAHMNSCIFTDDKKFLYISFKHIGIIKLEYETKRIVWILGKRTIDKWEIPDNSCIFEHQHDLHLIDNNTLYFWDNKHQKYTELELTDNKIINYKTFHASKHRIGPMAVMGNALKVTDNIVDICYGTSLSAISLLNSKSKLPIVSEFDVETGQKFLDITILDNSSKLINTMYQVNRGVNIYEN